MRDYLRDPIRTALTLFGIVLGAASIVFLASALTSAAAALKRMNQQATGTDVSRVQARPLPPSAARAARELSERDAQAIEEVEDPALIAGGTRRMTVEAYVGRQRFWVGLQSGGAGWAQLAGMELAAGRWLQPAEETERLCMIGYDIWQRGWQGRWPLGDDRIILHGRVPLRVVGVFKPRPPLGGGGGDGTWRFDRKVYMSNTVFKRSVDGAEGVGEIVFKEKLRIGEPDLTAIALRLTPLIERLHLGAQNFQFDALNKRRQSEELIVLGLGAILFACGLVAMIVGGVNVMNAQLVLLGEKTREYGIRRALGASARSLQIDVVVQAMTLTSIGGALGVVFGVLGSFLLAQLLTLLLGEWAFHVVPWSIAVALFSAVVVGLLAGLGPARRAGKLVPSACLRSAA